MTALGEYIAENSTGSAPSRKGGTHTGSHRLGPQITSSNVGYQLLQKAGWTEGQGLGSNQQGQPIPLGAYHQQARQGIGTSTKQAENQPCRHDNSSKHPRPVDNVDRGKSARQKLPVPDVPEDPQVKRQRHQQVCLPHLLLMLCCPSAKRDVLVTAWPCSIFHLMIIGLMCNLVYRASPHDCQQTSCSGQCPTL